MPNDEHAGSSVTGNPRPRILIVDNQCVMRRFLRESLLGQGYEILEAGSGREALRCVPAKHPNLMLLDFALSDIHGMEVTRTLREWTEMPILALSAATCESDKIAALDAGADDYITKPFGIGELLARIRAALRHAAGREAMPIFNAGELRVDLSRRNVEVRGEHVQLTPTEYDLLKALVRHADRVLTHRQLIRELWGGACHEDDMHLLRVNVSNLRRKLETDPTRPKYVRTECGVGYRLTAA